MTAQGTALSPRVAITSVGLGRIQRGYERYISGIFGAFQDRFDIALYKGAGSQGSGEKVPTLLGPITTAARLLPLGLAAGGAEYKTYKHDCLAFSLALLPDLLRNRIDVVHVIDYPLAIALLRLRRIFRYPARVIFTDGGLMPPQYYPRADHVHQVAEAQFQLALGLGIPQGHMTLVPCGLHTQHFSAASDRRRLRKKHGIADSTFVILGITAVNRAHKRVDYIIEEASRVPGDILLWIDGRPEDLSLWDVAREKLSARCRITHVSTAEVPELYHLADIFVHGALEEGFGLAICEAAAAGLMVLVHDSPHFRWLVGDHDCFVDMSVPGNLSRRLREVVASPQQLQDRGQDLALSMRDRFDWGVLAPAYMEMYRKVAELKPSSNPGRS